MAAMYRMQKQKKGLAVKQRVWQRRGGSEESAHHIREAALSPPSGAPVLRGRCRNHTSHQSPVGHIVEVLLRDCVRAAV
jgi:hypothetical protein